MSMMIFVNVHHLKPLAKTEIVWILEVYWSSMFENTSDITLKIHKRQVAFVFLLRRTEHWAKLCGSVQGETREDLVDQYSHAYHVAFTILLFLDIKCSF